MDPFLAWFQSPTGGGDLTLLRLQLPSEERYSLRIPDHWRRESKHVHLKTGHGPSASSFSWTLDDISSNFANPTGLAVWHRIPRLGGVLTTNWMWAKDEVAIAADADYALTRLRSFASASLIAQITPPDPCAFRALDNIVGHSIRDVGSITQPAPASQLEDPSRDIVRFHSFRRESKAVIFCNKSSLIGAFVIFQHFTKQGVGKFLLFPLSDKSFNPSRKPEILRVISDTPPHRLW